MRLGRDGVLAVVERRAHVPQAVADGVSAGVVIEVLLDDGRDQARRNNLTVGARGPGANDGHSGLPY